jgi:choloylglycine hydrolase
MMLNPRNLEKMALVDTSEHPARWISKFGSITFNQVGRDLPFGGMNERGLVVEQMGLNSTVYPSKDNRCAISACQWIQFQLDNYSTVEEVISSDTLVRIVDATSKFHFLICDRYGHTAVMEFLNGKLVCYTGKELPVQALANSSYEESLSCYTHHGDTQTNRSLFDFCTAALQTVGPAISTGDSTIGHAFDVLHAVSQGVLTKWSIAYDITNMKIYFICFETPAIVGARKIFVKNREDAGMKVVDIKGWKFNCAEESYVLDLDSPEEGAMNRRFVKYTTDINKEFIQ